MPPAAKDQPRGRNCSKSAAILPNERSATASRVGLQRGDALRCISKTASAGRRPAFRWNRASHLDGCRSPSLGNSLYLVITWGRRLGERRRWSQSEKLFTWFNVARTVRLDRRSAKHEPEKIQLNRSARTAVP